MSQQPDFKTILVDYLHQLGDLCHQAAGEVGASEIGFAEIHALLFWAHEAHMNVGHLWLTMKQFNQPQVPENFDQLP